MKLGKAAELVASLAAHPDHPLEHNMREVRRLHARKDHSVGQVLRAECRPNSSKGCGCFCDHKMVTRPQY